MTASGRNVLEQLQQLKCITVRIGVIHEAQKVQVQNYPLTLTGVKSAVSRVDIGNKTVTYDLVFKGRRPSTKTLQPQMAAVTRWLRTVLWDETSVYFQHDGKNLATFPGVAQDA